MGKNKALIFLVICALNAFIFIDFFGLPEAAALTKTNNWDFNGNANGWTATNDNGTNVCGNATSSTADSAMATLAYSGAVGGQTAFQGVTPTGKNIKGRGMAHQTVVAPGTGTVKVKGRMSYYANSPIWNATVSSNWVRLDLYDNTNTNFVAALACVAFNTNQAWTTSSFSSDTELTGGTTYTIRVTFRGNTANTNGAPAITLAADNIIVNFAPVGLTASAPTDTSNAALTWTASSGGTGAPGLHATTPYKVYRKTSSPVTTSDFLANTATNSYTDSTTFANTTYYFAVSDLDTNGIESPLSAEGIILTLPASPTNLSFSNVQSSTLRVNWNAPANGASGYKVERCQGTGCSSFSEVGSGITNLYFDDSGLSASTTYRYQIRATNATGDSAYSTAAEQETGVSAVASVTLTSDGIVNYGIIPLNTSKNTITLSDTQTVQNDGNATENLNIKTSNATNGVSWILGASAGSDIFVHEFSVNSGDSWIKFSDPDVYQTLVSGINQSATQNFDLRITTPAFSSDVVQKSINITIQAVF